MEKSERRIQQGRIKASCVAAGIKACRACGKKSHNTAACLKKQKVEKGKKEGENKNSKKDTNPKAKTESQERRDASENRKRNLSQQRDNRSPQRPHNSYAQVRV